MAIRATSEAASPAASLPGVSSGESHADPRGKQAERMRRFLLGASTYAVVSPVLLFGVWLGLLEPAVLAPYFVAAILINGTFYALFASGLNQRFPEPSLTALQIACAIVLVLLVGYYAGEARGAVLLALPVAFLFGVFKLGQRELLWLAAFGAAGYAGLIGVLRVAGPDSVDLTLELFRLTAIAAALICFALIGGRIARIRAKLKSTIGELRSTVARLGERELSLAEAQRIAGLGDWSYDLTTGEAEWSRETYRIYDIDPSRPAPVGEAFRRLIHEGDRARLWEQLGAAIAEGRAYDCEFRIRLPGSGVRWAYSRCEPLIDSSGRVTHLHGITMDITERKRAELLRTVHFAVTRLLADAESVAEANSGILQVICETLDWDCGARWSWDDVGGALYCNEAWNNAGAADFVAASRAQVYKPGEGGLIRRAWASGEPVWIPDVAVDPTLKRREIAREAGLHTALAFPILVGGERFGVIELFTRDVRPRDDSLVEVMQVLGSQIGQFIARRTAEERNRALAHFDPLTGLLSRTNFNQRLEHAIARARRTGRQLAVLFMDLDGFKAVNDSLGHEAGDQVLKEFSRRLIGAMRKADSAARFGGDEFVVLVEDCATPPNVESIVARILSFVEQPFAVDGRECRVGASIGISVWPDDCDDGRTLLKNADAAMYAAKQTGKNRYSFYGSGLLAGRAIRLAQ